MHSKHHFRRALDPSTVHYRAFGDSYSAGPGAGTSLEGKAAGDCRQFSGAYPHQLNEFLRPGQALAPEDFVSCTGAVSAQIAGQAKAHMNKDIKFVSRNNGHVALKDG